VFDLQPVHIYLITLFLSVPILGMITGLLKEWLVLRSKQAAPGKVRDVEQKLERMLDRAGLQLKNLEQVKKDLEEKLERLERENADYAERLQNLESIVVSQAWEVLHKPKSQREAPDAPVAAIPTRPHQADEPTLEQRNRQRAADLARRVGS
jgi:chromosome segregation ATPase